jgi:hypothetical protein
MNLSTMATSPTRLQNLTVEELAAEMRTSPETVHYWIKVVKAPKSFKVGRRRLFLGPASTPGSRPRSTCRPDAHRRTAPGGEPGARFLSGGRRQFNST